MNEAYSWGDQGPQQAVTRRIKMIIVMMMMMMNNPIQIIVYFYNYHIKSANQEIL